MNSRKDKTPDQLFQDYLNQQHHSSSFNQYDLDDVGVWKVEGEGDGYGSGKTIGIFEGKLEHVVRFAVVQDQFWSYGQGGSFKKLDIKKIDANSVYDHLELKAEKERLEAELARINTRLKELN